MRIAEDYVAIKRRMDELSGNKPVTFTVHIDAHAVDAGVAERIAQGMRAIARGGLVASRHYIVGERTPEVWAPFSAG